MKVTIDDFFKIYFSLCLVAILIALIRYWAL